MTKNLLGKANDLKSTAQNLKDVFGSVRSPKDILEMDRSVIKQPWQLDNGLYNFYKTISLDPSEHTVNVTSYPLVFFVKPPIRPFVEQYGTDFHPAITERMEKMMATKFHYMTNEMFRDISYTNWLNKLTLYFRSIDLPNLAMNVEPSVTNRQRESYMTPTFFSGQNGATFTTTFIDNEYLEVLRTFKVWYDYIKLLSTGDLFLSQEMLLNNIVDYKSSVYILGLAPNFIDIQYFAKYTGVHPNNIPLSSIAPSKDESNLKTFNIEFTYDYFEFLDINTLIDFNIIGQELGIRTLQKADGTQKIEVY